MPPELLFCHFAGFVRVMVITVARLVIVVLARRVAENVAQVIGDASLPAQQVALKAHISKAALRRRLRGEVAFSVRELEAISEILDISIRDLMRGRQARAKGAAPPSATISNQR